MSEEQIRDTLAQMVRVGFVSARQPERMRVRVELRDTVTASLVTDWLPVLCPRACGDLVYDLPDVGDQVLCLFLGYGLEQGFVLGAMYGKAGPPVSSGDIWQRTFADGTVLAYDRAAHKLTAQVQGEVSLRSSGPLTLEAPVLYLRGTLVNTARDGAPGNAVLSGGLTVVDGGVRVPDADVLAGAVSLTSHLTSGVQPGSGQSGPPVGGGSGSGGSGGTPTDADRFASRCETSLATLSPTEELLLCLPKIAGAEAERCPLPEDRQGWLYLREMFLRWFSRVACTDAQACGTPFWVSWDWIMSYERARIRYNVFTNALYEAERHIFNGAARQQLGRILQRRGCLREDRMAFDFISLPWSDWEDAYHTLVAVPRIREVDGLMAAMAGFTLRALAAGHTESLGRGRYVVHVERMAVFAHDSFNFAEESNALAENLGYWSCRHRRGGLRKAPEGQEADFTALTNDDFRAFRETHGFGGDFPVLSRPHPVASFSGGSYEYAIC